MSIHFNPETRPQFPQTLIYDEGVMDKADPFYKFYANVDRRFTHKSREEVLAHNATGRLGGLRTGSCTTATQ